MTAVHLPRAEDAGSTSNAACWPKPGTRSRAALVAPARGAGVETS